MICALLTWVRRLLFFAPFFQIAQCSAEDRPWWGGYGGIGWSDSNHGDHVGTGLIMGGAGRLLLEPLAPGKQRLYKIGLATVATAGGMLTYEYIMVNDGRGKFDLLDAAYGGVGGLVGAVGVDLGITGARTFLAPRRIGAALTMTWRF